MSSVESTPYPPFRIQDIPGAYSSTPDEPGSPTIISSQLSLSQAVHKRRSEYTRPYTTRVKVGTWNVASLSGTERDIGGWFVDGKGVSERLSGSVLSEEDRKSVDNHRENEVATIEEVADQEARRTKKKSTIPKNDQGSIPGGDDIGLYVLGLQEIVDISSATEALRPFTDPHPAKKWKKAVADALPAGYLHVAEQQLIGLYLVIYASPLISPTISSISTTSVGTGLMGYMGNKGAVTARIVLGETTRMVFVNCHLTAGVEKGSLERRNWDASQILNRTKFEPVYDGGGVMEEFGEGIGDEDFAFWFGDLNYRLDSIPPDDVRRLLTVHTQKEYRNGQEPRKATEAVPRPNSPVVVRDGEGTDRPFEDNESSSHRVAGSMNGSSVYSTTTIPSSEQMDPSSDPSSLQTTLSSLLPHDQLHVQMRTRKAFHDGWREGPIYFLPTYKYDAGSVAMFDSSEKRRGPSWCDRILYRTRKDRLEYESLIREEEEAKKRDEEMQARGVDKAAAEDEDILFDYDPKTDGAVDEYDENLDDTTDPEVVLTKTGFEDKLHLDYYTSHQRVLSSDHKPLDAVFTLTYDAVDPELKAIVHQDVVHELDKAENEGRPGVTIVVDHQHDQEGNLDTNRRSPTFEGVNFGHVKYDHVKTRTITIANTGRVPATVGFVDRSVDQGQPGGVSPPWLNIRFDRASDNKNTNPCALQAYTIEPGDAINVGLTVHVTDMEQVRRLNEGLEKLEDILVLRIHNGRDYFLPLRGKWLQSTFGRSLEKLTHIPEGGVRKLQHQRPDKSSHSGSHGSEGVKWSAPREIFRLTEAIEELVERSIAEWGMKGEQEHPPWDDPEWPFVARKRLEPGKGKENLEHYVREGLDTDRPFAEQFPPETECRQRLEAIAETLLDFLKSLEDGIVTEVLWAELEKGMIEREKAKKTLAGEVERTWILDVLSVVPAHSISFTFITFMLSRVANEIAPVRLITDTPRSSSEVTEQSKPQLASQESARRRRQQVDGAFAAIFADAMVRTSAGGKGKETKASESRRRSVVEIFLRSKWDDS